MCNRCKSKEELKAEKAARISATMAENKALRKFKTKVTFNLKIQENHLSKQKLEAIEGQFREGKWVVNYTIGSPYPFEVKIGDSVQVKVFNPVTNKCDIIEEREFQHLGSQLKQSLVKKVQQDIINLSKNPRRGKLKFVQSLDTIPLKQHGITYTVDPAGYVQLQNVGRVKVNGTKQMFKDGFLIGEIASGKLIRKPSGYYIQVLMYVAKEDNFLGIHQVETKGYCPGFWGKITGGVK